MAALKLDELELASLRGDLQVRNLPATSGRGPVPRLSPHAGRGPEAQALHMAAGEWDLGEHALAAAASVQSHSRSQGRLVQPGAHPGGCLRPQPLGPHPFARLQEVSCSLNFESHSGRGKLALASPRYSGLRGDSLSGGFRWERDVVRLEKLVLVQQRSRWAPTAAPLAWGC